MEFQKELDKLKLGLKLRHVYLPFLVASAGTLLFYYLLRWTLDTQLGILHVKKDLLNFYIPLALSWASVLIWLRKRIRILDIDGPQSNGRFLYQILLSIAMGVPIVISQQYLEKASFDLIRVSCIAEIKEHKHETYFQVDSFSVRKNHSSFYTHSQVTGRFGDELHLYQYFSCPFDQVKNIWYGVGYSKSLRNNRNTSMLKNFFAESQADFATYNFQQVTYFELLRNSDERERFLRAIQSANPGTNSERQLVLVPNTEPFEQRLGLTFHWIFYSFSLMALVVFLMVALPRLRYIEQKS